DYAFSSPFPSEFFLTFTPRFNRPLTGSTPRYGLGRCNGSSDLTNWRANKEQAQDHLAEWEQHLHRQWEWVNHAAEMFLNGTVGERTVREMCIVLL
ncbi:12565_t:CDS:2, partial [Acaulospora colombiana]